MCDETINQALEGGTEEEEGFVETLVAEAISRSGEETEDSGVENVVWITLKQSVTAVQSGQTSPTDKVMTELVSNTKKASVETSSLKDVSLQPEESKTEPTVESRRISTKVPSLFPQDHIDKTEGTKASFQMMEEMKGGDDKPSIPSTENGQIGGSSENIKESYVKDMEAKMKSAEVEAMTTDDVIQPSVGQTEGTNTCKKRNIFRRLVDTFCGKKAREDTDNKPRKYGSWFKRNFLCCLAKQSATVEPVEN